MHQLPPHAAHLEAWYAAYHRTASRSSASTRRSSRSSTSSRTSRAAASRARGHLPGRLDDDYGTWNAYSNQYWPAEYLIDRNGEIRHIHFGEGDYGATEEDPRRCSATRDDGARSDRRRRPHADRGDDARDLPRLRAARPLRRLEDRPERARRVRVPVRPRPERARATAAPGRSGQQAIVAGLGARLRLKFQRALHLPRARRARARPDADRRQAHGNGQRRRVPALHDQERATRSSDGTASSCASPGVKAYAFTFG